MEELRSRVSGQKVQLEADEGWWTSQRAADTRRTNRGGRRESEFHPCFRPEGVPLRQLDCPPPSVEMISRVVPPNLCHEGRAKLQVRGTETQGKLQRASDQAASCGAPCWSCFSPPGGIQNIPEGCGSSGLRRFWDPPPGGAGAAGLPPVPDTRWLAERFLLPNSLWVFVV